jgi:hypothetical protein
MAHFKFLEPLSLGPTGYFGTELYPPPGRRKAAANNDKLPQPPKAMIRQGAAIKDRIYFFSR